jgi:hypothetical protein
MSHSHEHSHDQSTYYMEQLCTIGVCGLLGVVAILLYYQRILDFMLARYLHPYVLWSGIAILSLAALRGVFLWMSVGRASANHHHDHGHDHDHDHAHEHSHDMHHEHMTHGHDLDPVAAGHDHGHGHEHGWNPWRYIVLCLPIMLYFLGLPNQGFTSAKAIDVEDSDKVVADKGEGKEAISLNFKDLESWAYSDNMREWSEGQTGQIKGQFAPGKSAHAFGLVRYKITCCAPDAIPLHVAILSPEPIAGIKSGTWVQVTGQIQYRKRKDRDEYAPVLKLRSAQDIVQTPPDDDPYLQ